MVGKPTKLSTKTTAIEFTVADPPWSTLYEKRCELEVYCRWHGLRVPKARSAELPRDESANILARLEQENKQMQRRLDRFHAIQKVRKHLKRKAQERAIKSINEVTALDDESLCINFGGELSTIATLIFAVLHVLLNNLNRIEELLGQPDMRLRGEPGSGVLWSKDDVYARVLGPERPGRVRGVGLGITPSGRSATNASQFTSTPLLPSRTTQRISELENHSSRVTEQLAQVQEQLAQTEARHQEQLAQTEARHQEQLASIEARHQEQLSSIDARNQQQMAEMTARMNTLFAQISQGWQCLMGTLHGKETVHPLLYYVLKARKFDIEKAKTNVGCGGKQLKSELILTFELPPTFTCPYEAITVLGDRVFLGAVSSRARTASGALLEAVVEAGITATNQGFHQVLFLSDCRDFL
ncbi:hypothetical protein SO802_010808 [Lithocarpus litseifolius]|uniref:RNase H type-1 domain-containing protein n=1 Tax=Lithocarpus litseifolius TaxID=425828 RepID=A0AAW2DKT6_9ROSI